MGFAYAQQLAQGSNELRLELRPLVTVESLRSAETADDVVDYRYRNDDPVDPLWAEESVIGQVSLEDVPVEDQVALMRAAMIVGLGIEYNLSGKTALLVGATFNNGLFNVANNRNFGSGRREEHIRPGLDGSLDPAILEADDAGYEVKMIDNAILMSLGLLF